MALQDPTASLFPSPAYWDDDLERRLQEYATGGMGPAAPQQLLGDVGAPLVGALLNPQQPATPPPAPARPVPTAGNPFPEAYDDFESKGGQPPYFDPRSQTYRDPDTGNTVFPFGPTPEGAGGQPMPVTPGRSPRPVPRTDDARIGLHGGGNVADEIARGGDVPWMPAAADEVFGKDTQPDAISGGMVPGQEQIGAHQTSGTPEMPIEYLDDEEIGVALSSMPTEIQEMYRAKVEGARANLAASRKLELAEKTAREAQDNARIFETAVKQSQRKAVALDAEAKELASHKIDPDRWWGTRSTGQKIAGFVAAIVGGLAQHATGGRNVGMEAIEREIDRDIAAQEANLRNAQQGLNARRGALAEEFARTGDLHAAREKVRIASLDSAIQKLEAEVQTFDPRGTTALRIMDTLNQAYAQRAAAVQKYQAEEQKRIEAALKLQLEQQKVLEDARHHRAQERSDATRAGADWLRAKTDAKKADAEIGSDTPLTPEELRARGINVPEGVTFYAMSIKKAKELAEAGRSFEEWNKIAQERVVPGITVKDKSGRDVPFVALGNAESVEKFRKRAAKLEELVALIDDARRTRTGWSTDIGNSQERAELATIWGKAQIAAKDYFELGAITKQDEPLIKGVLGTSDPSQLRDPLPGMEKARSLLIKDFRRDLIAHGFPKDQEWDIRDMQKQAAVTTPEQGELKRVLGTTAGVADTSGTKKVVMGDEQRSLIDKWEQMATSGTDIERKRALDWLGQAAKGAALSTVKGYAQDALQRIANPSVPAVEEVGTHLGASGAREPAIDKYGLPVEDR